MQRLTSQQKESIGLLSIGTFLEYFDLMLYVHMAVLLNELFFPKTDATTALLLSSLAFCSTFVFRPIGAIVFGWIGDNIGRRASLIITTFLMAGSCVVMAILPTYDEIGITAAWIMIICRITQGMSSMGEISGAEIYLTETIKVPYNNSLVAILFLAAAIGAIAALGIASLVTSYGFNWRYAFWFGAIIAVVGAVARTRLRETPDFVDFKTKSKKYLDEHCETEEEKQDALKYSIFQEPVNKKTLVAVFLLFCPWPAAFYIAYIHCGNILQNSFGYTAEQVIHQNFIISIVEVLSIIPPMLLVYKIYPLLIQKVKLIIFSVFILVLPYLLSIATTPFDIFVIQSICIFFVIDTTSMHALVVNHFPVFKRFTYNTLLYALSRAVMYVITSFGFVLLIKYYGNWGLLIIMGPIVIGYMLGLNHFKKLEKEAGNYHEGWFNISKGEGNI